MPEDNIAARIEETSPHKNRVHKVLAHSYLFYFFAFLFAFLLDFAFPLKIFGKAYPVLGTALIFAGTLLIAWAQVTSHKLKKDGITKEAFFQGPYRYTRGPTNFGIFAALLGFGIMINSAFIFVVSIISFLITRFTFIRKEEKILAEKYGEPYLEYKKSVKL